MKFIVEFEGVVVDPGPTYFEVHREVAAEVGWSHLDQPTFWRLTRTKGREANLLPGARPVKVKDYFRRVEHRIEADDVVERLNPQPRIDELLERLGRHGACCLITLGSNFDARRRLLEHANLWRHFEGVASLNADPRLRSGELRALLDGDPRTVVVAATDSVIRAAGQAELFSVGLAGGACAMPRLHQAGADVVYQHLSGLVDSLSTGGQDLVRAGLLPLPWG